MEKLAITHTSLWNGQYIDHQQEALTEVALQEKIKAVRDNKYHGEYLPYVKVKPTSKQLESC